MYNLLLFVHILCAVVWVGGGVYAQLLAVRAQRSNDPTDMPKLGREIEVIGTRVFLPASILLFLAGLAMVMQSWSFGQLWISVSMTLWLASALAGSLYLGPGSKQVAQLFETEGPTSAAAREKLARLFLVSRIELASFVIIIALMVFKPGA